MTKFKMGDKVAVYNGERFVTSVYGDLGNGRYSVHDLSGAQITVHEKQLRKLIKKPKKEYYVSLKALLDKPGLTYEDKYVKVRIVK